ncbi:MAG TPA: hypothetical protein VMM55_14670 [Thermohalobaculum sp.]|nr:hypothetical protein [Thermohalobaculum sp.]
MLTDKPSLAVLPFDNLSDGDDYFADGLTDDLITDLSRIEKLFVIARNSTFAYEGKNVSAERVAEDLGVRYVLSGSVRRAGDAIRINAQLIDALAGVLFSGRLCTWSGWWLGFPRPPAEALNRQATCVIF